jgi:hypothetical protein
MVSIEPQVSRSVLGVVMARQRHSNWTPVIVSNCGDQTEGQKEVSKADDWGPACSVSDVSTVCQKTRQTIWIEQFNAEPIFVLQLASLSR